MESVGLLTALRRHLVPVAAATVLGLLVAIAVIGVIPREYEARATLFLRVQAASSSIYARAQFAVQRAQSYPPLLASPALLRSVSESVGLDESPQELQRHLTAVNPANTVLIEVTATSSNAKTAAALANAGAAALASKVNTLENSESVTKNAVMLLPQVTAQAPDAPSSPNVPVILGLGLLAGFVLAAIAALVLERTRPRIRTVADVRRATGLPVVAQLPKRPGSLQAATAAAAVNLRTILRGDVPQLLLLTPADAVSARSGAQLLIAWGLAQTGRRVLTMAAPSDPAPLVGAAVQAGAPGASEVLAGRLEVGAAVISSGHGFDILPTGDTAVAPSAFALETSADAAVVPMLTGHDVTVVQASVDSRPLDLETVGRLARIGMLVVARGAKEHEVLHALTRIRAFGISLIGVVMTEVASPSERLAESWVDADFVRLTTESRLADDRRPSRIEVADGSALDASSTALPR